MVRDDELQEALTPGLNARRKLVTVPLASEMVERWRHRGWRIGLLHLAAGGAAVWDQVLMEQARGWCDRLLVVVDWQRILRSMTISCLHVILLILFLAALGEDLNKMCFASSTSMSRCPRLVTGKAQPLLLQLPPGIIINLCSSWILLWRRNPHILPLRLETLSLGVRCPGPG